MSLYVHARYCGKGQPSSQEKKKICSFLPLPLTVLGMLGWEDTAAEAIKRVWRILTDRGAGGGYLLSKFSRLKEVTRTWIQVPVGCLFLFSAEGAWICSLLLSICSSRIYPTALEKIKANSYDSFSVLAIFDLHPHNSQSASPPSLEIRN